MKYCETCRYCKLMEHYGLGLNHEYQCVKIGNCDMKAIVTAYDDEGGQYAVVIINQPTKFGCILHKEKTKGELNV